MLNLFQLLRYPKNFHANVRGSILFLLSGELVNRIQKRVRWVHRQSFYKLQSWIESLRGFVHTFFDDQQKKHELINELCSWKDKKDCDIFITMPVRKLGNPHCYFSLYLSDILEMSQNPNRIITYVLIDDDDDINYFIRLKKKYEGKLRLRFFVLDKSEGYFGGHKMHSWMITKNLADYAIWLLGASDAKPMVYGWDKILLNSVKKSACDCIIGGGPQWCAGAIHGPNPDEETPIYWVGTDDFIFASKQTMLTLEKETKNLDGWEQVGDTWHIDGFFADLARQLVQKGAPEQFVATEPLLTERDARGWQGVKARENNRNKTLKTYFGPTKQAIHSKLADAIILSNKSEYF